MMKRLQGKAFADERCKLKMWRYEVSDNGNIRAELKYKVEYQNKTCRYHDIIVHWLNEEEKERFINSKWYKTHKPYTGKEK